MTGSLCLALKVSTETVRETEEAVLSYSSLKPSDTTAHGFIRALQSRGIISDKPGQREA